MSVTGIIAEYNPFHLGHQYQLKKVRAISSTENIIVSVMSGHITQRGELTILDKWTRARFAVEHGSDLVIELPTVFACRSAQDFARGGVRLLAALGSTNHIAFGAEDTNIKRLIAVSQLIDNPDVLKLLHNNLKQGLSYAMSMARAISYYIGEPNNNLFQPNNILAIEYLRACQSYAPQLKPILIPRKAAQHNDVNLTGGISSASAIRSAIYHRSFTKLFLAQALPPKVYDYIHQLPFSALPNYDIIPVLVKYSLLQRTPLELKNYYGMVEGLENRLLKAPNSANLENFIKSISGKRYPYTRIARLIMMSLLQLQRLTIKEFDTLGPLYIRPLAFNERGKNLLRQIKKAGRLPIISQPAKIFSAKNHYINSETSTPIEKMLGIDILATNLWQLCISHPNKDYSDFLHSPIFIKQS